MIDVYRPLHTDLKREPAPLGPDGVPVIHPDAVWVDLFRPTREEDRAAEAFIGAELLTREEMEEIEPSSRLSMENGTLYLTAVLLCRSESSEPGTTAVSFIFARNRLVTLRYDEPGTFPVAVNRMLRPVSDVCTARAVLVTLLETAIDRLADILERATARIGGIGTTIFENHAPGQRPDYNLTLRAIGREGLRLGHVQESLLGLSRLLLFLDEKAEATGFGKDDRARMLTMQRDIQALSDHVHGLDERNTFLLDATLGLVSIQQNDIIKIFSVLAVIFMPPTLVASIYGMNFDVMPELHWTWGYPYALALMVAAAVVTFLVFRWRRWL
ncbi:magnesium transporter CorA family protein [Chthonobacter rhizosphaerae]|uniref:magnesium transporter CorA family protein n=1 Tax=Chthonobacter rhizosphaerae TaxID=2735553 RepID=UPI0015EEEC8E|nr:magnesium transporter CorA family protein [Chthonobacter rhizosphaerae]